jgi:glycosyltransferase involved in cell wall biosynthesis
MSSTAIDKTGSKIPKIVFVTSHPIQYQAPVFRCLAQRTDLEFTVLFAMIPDATAQGAGFGVAFKWDLPLLDGYRYQLLKNVSKSPGVTHFQGCDTPDIKALLQELKADLVIVNGWVVKTCLQALWACRRLRIPCIVRGEANNLRQRPWWKRWLQRRLVRQYTGVLPIGKANREFYRNCGVSDEKMFNAPYCVENQRFSRAAADAEPRRTELRSRWGVPEDAICYLYCGKFEHKKHPVELVEAFLQAQSSLRQNASDSRKIHLLMVGDGVLRERCEELATRHSPLTSITFTGFLNQTQIVEAYVAADIIVLPSDAGETWGLVVNEAMACGRPAVVSDLVGCCQDLVISGKTGWSFQFGRWDELTELFVGLNRKDIDNCHSHCCRLVEEYSPNKAAEGIANAVHSLLGNDAERSSSEWRQHR